MAEEHQLLDVPLGLRPAGAHAERIPAVPEVPGIDVTPPVVGNAAPAAGSAITSGAVVTFDVTDETSLAYQAVLAFFPSTNDYDVIFDGTNFATKYAGSSRTPIANGWRYSVQYAGGWPASPEIRVRAVDDGGNIG